MVKKVKNTIDQSARIAELENNYRRALADYQNQERRHKEASSAVIKMASAGLIEKLLVILDGLYLAQNHLQDQGLQMLLDQFNSILKQEGLSEIKSTGETFDPNSMDCTETVPGEKDKVVETLSRGYLLFDKVLRPAKVKVGSGEPVIASLVPEPKQSHSIK